jgi:hypothetical protein
MFARRSSGSFALLAAVALVGARGAVARRGAEALPEESSGGGRPLREIVRQPVFIVAALAATLGYGLMNLLMTATPLAMDFLRLAYAQAAMVISWHVVGMYAPGFVTGSLIGRFGVLSVIVAGRVVMALGAGVSLTGNQYAPLPRRARAVGIGWNFMYTGGRRCSPKSYRPGREGAHARRQRRDHVHDDGRARRSRRARSCRPPDGR